jgi:hypothetical protein
MWGRLGPSGAIWGASQGHLSPSCGYLRTTLGPSWHILRLSWPTFETSWPISRPPGPIVRSSWPIVGLSSSILGISWLILGLPGPILRLLHLFKLPSSPQFLLASNRQAASAGDTKRNQFTSGGFTRPPHRCTPTQTSNLTIPKRFPQPLRKRAPEHLPINMRLRKNNSTG